MSTPNERSSSTQSPSVHDAQQTAQQQQPLQSVAQAENDMLRRVGLLSDQTSTADLSRSSSSIHKIQQRNKHVRIKLWRQEVAALVAQGVIAFARYPVDTATMYTQFSGVVSSGHAGASVADVGLGGLWRGMAVGFWYHWERGIYMRLVNGILEVAISRSLQTRSLVADIVKFAMQYAEFTVLYGLLRQSVYARLLAASVGRSSSSQYPSVFALVIPVGTWIRDILLFRRPRGAVLCLCMREMLGFFVSKWLHTQILYIFVSQGMFSAYATVLKANLAVRSAVTAGLIRVRGIARLTHGQVVSDDEDDEIEVEFVTPDAPTVPPSRGSSSHDSIPSVGKEMQSKLLMYMQYISTMASSIATRALIYPVNSVVIRLMADETGLTSHGYTGFFDCLARTARSSPQGSGLLSLYAGFTRALVADLAFGWLAAEIAHVLFKTTWAEK
ncbi:hypothetical protein IWW48_001250 [Coemansia sp. RSA 1200]|nr:hypothetical protein IWW48_001250 [Coemansia sp. RSA 1200]